MHQEALIPSSDSPFVFQNHPIRTVSVDNALWFVAKDVCAALDIAWTGATLANIPTEWATMLNLNMIKHNRKVKCITEPAVYKLAFRSNKPDADAFTNWVASEVIPAIRNTGKFEAPALPDTSPLTQSSRAELKAIVDAKLSTYPSDVQGKARSEIWVRFNRHFKIAEYSQLPMCRMPDARDYLVEMKPKALAKLEAKPEQKALPEASSSPALIHVERGPNRAKSRTEQTLYKLLLETNNIDTLGPALDDFFERLRKVSGPINLQALDAMRRTDDNLCTDSLIQTMSYHRWYAREKIHDAVNSARDACRSAIVVARLLGV